MDWKKITKELLVVTLGVFIAMLMNSWNERRQDRQEARQYLEGIYEEMKANIDTLNRAIPYHQGILDGLFNDPLNVQLTLNVARVSNTAWKLAENNVFKNNIDKKLYYQIAQAYNHHNDLVTIQRQADERMSELNMTVPLYELQLLDKMEDEQTIRKLQALMMQAWIPTFESWTYYEREYLKALEATTETLKNL